MDSNDFNSAETSTSASKKRKTLSSCDTCKLRKVKCNRDSDDQSCAQCIEKGIHCTTSGPKRPKARTGIRIRQARERFGEERPVTPTSSSGEERRATPNAFEQPSLPHLSHSSLEHSLSVSELVAELSGHFIDVCFTVINYPIRLYRWKDFRRHFEAAGRRPEQMASPMLQVMAMTLMAFGARASNSTALLGPGAPTLADFDAAEADYIYWGRRRDPICAALTEKTLQFAEEKHVFKVESKECIAVLLLLEILVDHGDQLRRKGRPYRTAAIGHARSLCEDPSMRADFLDLQQGGLGWLLYVRDTFAAAMAGYQPRLPERDIELICGRKMTGVLPTAADFIRAVKDDAVVWDPLVQIYDCVVTLMRSLAVRMAEGTPRADTRDDPFMDNSLWHFYHKLDDANRCINELTGLIKFVKLERQEGKNFRRYCQSVRLCCLHILFLIHRAIHKEIESLETRPSLQTVISIDEMANGGHSDRENRKSLVLALKNESDGRMRDGSRQISGLLWAMQNSLGARIGVGIMTGTYMVYETLPVWAEILCTLPTKDEGAHVEYTLDTKIQEVERLLSTYRSLGWAWADMADTIVYVEQKYDALKLLRSNLQLSRTTQLRPPHMNGYAIHPEASASTRYIAPRPHISFSAFPEPTQEAGASRLSSSSMAGPMMYSGSYVDFQSALDPSYSMIGEGTFGPSPLPQHLPFRPAADNLAPAPSFFGANGSAEFLDGLTPSAASLPSYEDNQAWEAALGSQFAFELGMTGGPAM